MNIFCIYVKISGTFACMLLPLAMHDVKSTVQDVEPKGVPVNLTVYSY